MAFRSAITLTFWLLFSLTSGDFNLVLENDFPWPVKRVAEIKGDIVLGGLHMIHEREENFICGPIMPQGGLQAAEVMLYTVDVVNNRGILPFGLKLGAHILDDCDRDTYGLQQSVDFIKGKLSAIQTTYIKNEKSK